MIQSSATNPHQTSPYRHGNILMPADSYRAEEDEPPGLGRFILQGAAVGAFLGFVTPLTGMLTHPRSGYNFLYLILLPFFLAAGMLFGAVEGIIIWACTYIAGRQLNAVVRAGIGIVVLATLLFAYHVLLIEPSPYRDNVSGTDFFTYSIYIIYGVLFGLVTGSGFHPFHQLVSGTADSQYRALSAITGFALRLLVVFGLMESVIYLILSEQRGPVTFMYSAVALSHFAIATVIVFASTTFRVLVNLALIVNFPIIVFILNALKVEGQAPFGYVALAYLGLWAGFVLSRMPRETLASIKAELRYYLID